MSKITPQQAFEAAKVLWPDTSHIRSDGMYGFIYHNDTDYIGASVRNIDWPSGVYRWPMPEPKWRDATIEDFIAGSKARFRDNKEREWHESTISGFSRNGEFVWESSSGSWWRYCQVRDEEPS